MGVEFVGGTHEETKLYLVDAEVEGIGPQRVKHHSFRVSLAAQRIPRALLYLEI